MDLMPSVMQLKGWRAAAVVILIFAALGIVHAPQAKASLRLGKARLVSLNSTGAQGDDDSQEPSISADGRYVVFWSYASNLVADDSNLAADVFLRDLKTNTTTRVSTDLQGSQANDSSFGGTISPDGTHVAFLSWASNLVAEDLNGTIDVFVKNLSTGAVVRASVGAGGSGGNAQSTFGDSRPSLSTGGRYLAFSSRAADLVGADTNGLEDLFLRDMATGQTERISGTQGAEPNGWSCCSSLSSDGRFVAFVSEASNVAEGDTNGQPDVFVYDREAGTSQMVSVTPSGSPGTLASYAPSISGDGSVVAFQSYAPNLTGGDTNAKPDIFVRDLESQVTARVSLSSMGAQADGGSYHPFLSADGLMVGFSTLATNLSQGDANNVSDVYVYDIGAQKMSRISSNVVGLSANGASYWPALSSDGKRVALESYASDVVIQDLNGREDVFASDR